MRTMLTVVLPTGSRQVWSNGAMVVSIDDAEQLTGWRRKPEGLCRDDACILVRPDSGLDHAEGVDLVRLAEMCGLPFAAEPDLGVLALGEPADRRRTDLLSGVAPDFELPDVDGKPVALHDHRGHKVMLLCWASWCGCRYDLPAWEALHRELAPTGFRLISVALDHEADSAAEFIHAASPTHPALIDTEFVIADLYQVVNVPTVVWIDREGRIARPNDTQVGTDTFRTINGLDPAPAAAALRRWVHEDVSGLEDVDLDPFRLLPEDETQQARTHLRLAYHLADSDHPGASEVAARHFARAADLAPDDITIRRGAMRAQGIDPFGDAYFELRSEIEDRGVPIYRPLPDWS